jgi:hypothetical protein
MAVQSSTKKWMFIGGGVIVAAALVVLFQNYPPQPKDAAGTIGAAQRYHEPQISGADVQVSQDELSKWIQSDTFDRIVKDPQARKLFTDGLAAQVLADAGRNNLQLAEYDAVKTKRIEAPSDADAASVARRMALNNPEYTRLTIDANFANLLGPGLGGDSAKILEASFGGVDAAQKKLHLMSLDAADVANLKLHLQEVKVDGIRTAFQADPAFGRRVAIAVDYAVLMEMSKNNEALRAAFNNTEFVRLLAQNGPMAEALVVTAKRLEMSSDDK